MQYLDAIGSPSERNLSVCSCLNAQVVQEIKVLRSSVTAHEREVAERATLVTQERLIKSKVS